MYWTNVGGATDCSAKAPNICAEEEHHESSISGVSDRNLTPFLDASATVRSFYNVSAFLEGTVMKLPRRQVLHLLAGVAALPAVSRSARAQAYPTRPITLVHGFAPGGGVDTTARIVAEVCRADSVNRL